VAAVAELALKRKLSFPVSRLWQRWVAVIARNHLPVTDGRGAWRDNVFVGRLWRTIKYKEVYRHVYDSVPQARASNGRYLTLYNSRRPYSSLDGRTPDQACFNQPMSEGVAA